MSPGKDRCFLLRCYRNPDSPIWQDHVSDGPPVAILSAWMDLNDLPERQLRGDALSPAPEILPHLGAVDPLQANLDRRGPSEP